MLSAEEELVRMTLKGVLLDVDGTLMHSNDAHAEAFEQAFREFGYDVPFHELRPLMGMGGDKIFPKFAPGVDHKEGKGKEMSQRRTEIFLEKLPTLTPTRGTRELLERMKADGLILVAASSSKSDELEHLLKAAGVEDLIDERTTSSDAEQSKPAGDIIKVALEKAGLQPNEAVLLGDTPYDIKAARQAGVNTIAVRCGGFSDEQLEGARAIYDDPADLLAHYDSSPLKQAASEVEA
jgi:HAD superfamily hydrolase (TIGR01509 family)